MMLVVGQSDYVSRLQTYFFVLYPQKEYKYIAVPLETEKPDGTPFDMGEVRQLLAGEPVEAKVYVAFSLKFHAVMKELLVSLGFSDLVFYDAALDNQLKKQYFKQVFEQDGKDFYLLDEMPETHAEENSSVEVYMAKCVVDKPIKNYPDQLPAQVVPIQVGAALTEQRIADVTDATGDNISSHNRRYSEMTAFYWMWKNAKADYLGICHYRRLWVNLEQIAHKLKTTDVEAVLPLPTLCEHDVFEDYLLKHIPDVWQPMMDVLKEQSPDYYDAAQDLFKGRIFYASNMCILSRRVLDDLCSWMFPIVMEIEKRVGDLPDTYYNRYAGFCTERLITLYFLYNKNHWKVAHAEKVFIG